MNKSEQIVVAEIKVAVETDSFSELHTIDAVKYLWQEREKMYELLDKRNDQLRDRRDEVNCLANQALDAVVTAAKHEQRTLLLEAINTRLILRAKDKSEKLERLDKRFDGVVATKRHFENELKDAKEHIRNLLGMEWQLAMPCDFSEKSCKAAHSFLGEE